MRKRLLRDGWNLCRPQNHNIPLLRVWTRCSNKDASNAKSDRPVPFLHGTGDVQGNGLVSLVWNLSCRKVWWIRFGSLQSGVAWWCDAYDTNRGFGRTKPDIFVLTGLEQCRFQFGCFAVGHIRHTFAFPNGACNIGSPSCQGRWFRSRLCAGAETILLTKAVLPGDFLANPIVWLMQLGKYTTFKFSGCGWVLFWMISFFTLSGL